MTTFYPHIAGRIFGTPLAMDPMALEAMLNGIGDRLQSMPGQTLASAQDMDAAKRDMRAAARQRMGALVEGRVVDVGDGIGEYAVTPDGVAVVPIIGTLVRRFDWLSAMCGFLSYDTIKMVLTAAANDPRVKAILMDVDSPGGEAAGHLDCADFIRKVAQDKPLRASANCWAASAGYGLASAAQRLTLPRLAGCGSVGTVRVHVNEADADKMAGRRYTAVFSGTRKIDGWSHGPLSPEAQKKWQAEVAEATRKFAATVSAHRGLSVDAVLATESDVFYDQAAVDVGFADAVMTFDDALAALTADMARSSSVAMTFPRAASAAITTPKETTMSEPATPPAEPGTLAAAAAIQPDAAAAPVAVPAQAAAPAFDQAAVIAAGQGYAKAMADTAALGGADSKALMDAMASGLTPQAFAKAILDGRAQASAALTIAGQQAQPSTDKAVSIDTAGIYAARAKTHGPN